MEQKKEQKLTDKQLGEENLRRLTKLVFSEPDAREWLEAMKRYSLFYEPGVRINKVTFEPSVGEINYKRGTMKWPLFIDEVLNSK